MSDPMPTSPLPPDQTQPRLYRIDYRSGEVAHATDDRPLERVQFAFMDALERIADTHARLDDGPSSGASERGFLLLGSGIFRAKDVAGISLELEHLLEGVEVPAAMVPLETRGVFPVDEAEEEAAQTTQKAGKVISLSAPRPTKEPVPAPVGVLKTDD